VVTGSLPVPPAPYAVAAGPAGGPARNLHGGPYQPLFAPELRIIKLARGRALGLATALGVRHAPGFIVNQECLQMKVHISSPLTLLAAAASVLAGSNALGQAMEAVTVEAVREIVVGRGITGAPIRELTMRGRVSYADLDLTKAEDVAKLETRAKDTARSMCKELGAKIDTPAQGSTEERCVKESIDDAMAQIAAAVTAAKK
jgi:UrcA family protein